MRVKCKIKPQRTKGANFTWQLSASVKGSQCEGGEEGKGEEGREWHISAQTRTVCVCVLASAEGVCKLFPSPPYYCTLLHCPDINCWLCLCVCRCRPATKLKAERGQMSWESEKHGQWLSGWWWVTGGSPMARNERKQKCLWECALLGFCLCCVCVFVTADAW